MVTVSEAACVEGAAEAEDGQIPGRMVVAEG